MEVGVVLELPAPGVEDPGEPREIGADEPLVVGQPFEHDLEGYCSRRRDRRR
jgi:hypothetical protein